MKKEERPRMTKAKHILQVPAHKAAAVLPTVLAVGPAVLELRGERTTDGGSRARSFVARWSKGVAEADATVDIRPASKTATEIVITLEAPKGPKGIFWLASARRRLATLFSQALGYEIETRSIEETTPFEVRRTSAELVKSRSA
jgi:hypothetical protein